MSEIVYDESYWSGVSDGLFAFSSCLPWWLVGGSVLGVRQEVSLLNT